MNTHAQPLYVLEWSKRQNCLHVQPLDKTLADNTVRFMIDRPANDYVPIYVGTSDEVHERAEQLRHKIIERTRSAA